MIAAAVEPFATASSIFFRESRYLDARQWDDWLALYDPEAEFWVPTWKNEFELSNDPAVELSFIYLPTREHLVERVTRVRSGLSIASLVLPRTAHVFTNIEAQVTDETTCAITAHAVCTTHVFDMRFDRQYVCVSRHEVLLRKIKTEWFIRRKKIAILNDPLPPVFDFYAF